MLILPYIEQNALYAQANVTSYPGATLTIGTVPAYATLNNSWRAAGSVDVKTYQCPSDPNNKQHYTDAISNPPAGGWARGNYGVTASFQDYDHMAMGSTKSTTILGTATIAAPLMAGNFGSAFTQVQDGLSNTIMVAELRAGKAANDPRGTWAMGLPSSSIVNAGRDATNPTPNNRLGDSGKFGDELQGCQTPTTGYGQPTNPTIGSVDGLGCYGTSLMTSGQSRSMHTGGVNVCLGDGSVRFLKNSVDQLTWCFLISTADGNVITGDF